MIVAAFTFAIAAAVALLVWAFAVIGSSRLFRILAVTLALGLPIQSHALEVIGWDGSIVHCGANWLTTIGGFEKAKDAHDACTQAGEDHPRHGGDRKKLTVYESKGELKNFPTVRCFFESKNGPCGLIGVINPRCPVGSRYIPEADACFCDPLSKEANRKCLPGIDCDEMVRRLEQLKIDRDDPRYGFYRNQTCIAKKACQARPDMQDKDWLNKVVPAFVNPLIEKERDWKTVMEDCKRYSKLPGGRLLCQSDMADYHMRVDLQDALNRHGCGSASDWRKVGDFITECIDTGVEKDLMQGVQWLGKKIADNVVQRSRDAVRAKCMEARKGA